jgi:hypothetical protein
MAYFTALGTLTIREKLHAPYAYTASRAYCNRSTYALVRAFHHGESDAAARWVSHTIRMPPHSGSARFIV